MVRLVRALSVSVPMTKGALLVLLMATVAAVVPVVVPTVPKVLMRTPPDPEPLTFKVAKAVSFRVLMVNGPAFVELFTMAKVAACVPAVAEPCSVPMVVAAVPAAVRLRRPGSLSVVMVLVLFRVASSEVPKLSVTTKEPIPAGVVAASDSVRLVTVADVAPAGAVITLETVSAAPVVLLKETLSVPAEPRKLIVPF